MKSTFGCFFFYHFSINKSILKLLILKMNVTKNPHIFLADNLKIDSFESVSVNYDDLINKEITSLEDFIYQLKHRSELDALLEEDAAWKYIKNAIDTTNEAYSKDYHLFITEIQPKLYPLVDALNKIQNKSPYKASRKN